MERITPTYDEMAGVVIKYRDVIIMWDFLRYYHLNMQ